MSWMQTVIYRISFLEQCLPRIDALSKSVPVCSELDNDTWDNTFLEEIGGNHRKSQETRRVKMTKVLRFELQKYNP